MLQFPATKSTKSLGITYKFKIVYYLFLYHHLTSKIKQLIRKSSPNNRNSLQIFFFFIYLYKNNRQNSIFFAFPRIFVAYFFYIFLHQSLLYINFSCIIFISQTCMRYSQVVIILSSMVFIALSDFNPERLAVIDKDEKLKNYLVRGNLPIGPDRKFQIKELKQHLTNLTGLSKFQLVVVSFLNFLTAKQTKNRYIQQKFFQKYPQEGDYRTKLILGSLLDPFKYPMPVSKTLQFFGSLVDIDNIEGFISQLHNQIHKSGKNKIVFIHCSAGMDRTGLVAGSYKMKYLNYSMKRVLQQNSRFGGARKVMHFNALNGLKWYCLGIKQSIQECQVQ